MMNPYRNLLAHATNALLADGMISLNANEDDRKLDEEDGYWMGELLGESTVISFHNIGFNELRVSVWWKYNHDAHPQANSSGNSKELFLTSLPLAKRTHYSKFVGVCASAWLERKNGKYLQGRGKRGIHDTYCRRGEMRCLGLLPQAMPHGYNLEGPLHC